MTNRFAMRAVLLALACAWSAVARAQPAGVMVETTVSGVNLLSPMPWSTFSSYFSSSGSGSTAAATTTTPGTVPNFGGNGGAAELDSAAHLIVAELPPNVLTSSSLGANNGAAQLDSAGTLSSNTVTYTLSGSSPQTVTLASLAATAEAAAGNIAAQVGGTAYMAASSGATTTRSAATRAADTINVADYGAIGDMGPIATASYTIAAGGTSLTAGSGVFNGGMANKTIVLPGAAAPATLITHIVSVTDAQHAVLSLPAGTTLASASESIGVAVPTGYTTISGTYSITAGGSGNETLTAASSTFTAAMVGAEIRVPGAAAPGGLVSVISSVQSGTQVTLATAAVTALSSVNETPEVGTDDTTPINNAIAAAEARMTFQNGNGYNMGSVQIPDGAYLVRSVNLTGFAAASMRIFGRGYLWGVDAGYPVVDALGTRWIRWEGVDILGDFYSQPSAGLQIGRTNNTPQNSSDNNSYNHMLISGWFQTAGYYNKQSETTEANHDHFFSNATGYGHGALLDGPDYWPVTSRYVTDNETPNASQSFDENTMTDDIFTGYSPLEIGNTNRLRINAGYVVSGGPYGVTLRAMPSLNNYPAADNIQPWLDLHEETADYPNTNTPIMTDSYFLTGGDPSPQLEGMHIEDHGSQATNSLIKIDPASPISSVTAANVDIDLYYGVGSKLFNDPTKWAYVSGRIHVPAPSWMNLACGTQFQGVEDWAVVGVNASTSCQVIGGYPMQQGLAGQGVAIASSSVGGVLIQPSSNFYYAVGSAFTPTVTLSAPPSGTTATAHVSSYSVYGPGGIGAGGTGYTAGAATVQDGNGITVFNTTLTVSSSGAVTGFSFGAAPAYVATAIPGQLVIVQSGGSGATITGTNYQPLSVTIDNAGSGYTSLPSVTFSSVNTAGSQPGAFGVAEPTSISFNTPQTNVQAIMAARGFMLPQFTVASLPSCGAANKGTLYAVTDAAAPTWNGTLTGGGSTYAEALCTPSGVYTAH